MTLSLPQFMIIGVQKAGTTTIYDSLCNLNGFAGSSVKEVHFFDCKMNYEKGLGWYSKHFKSGQEQVSFEASPSYLYSSDAPLRIYKMNRSMKFIVILREPVSRCYSAWNMYRTFNENTELAKHIYKNFIDYLDTSERNSLKDLLFCEHFPTFTQAVKSELSEYSSLITSQEPSFVRRGNYYEQIQNYLKFFDLDNFLFIEQTELEASIGNVLSQIENFVGEESTGLVDLSIKKQVSNAGQYSLNISPEDKLTMEELKSFYKVPNENLFNLIGKRYQWWS